MSFKSGVKGWVIGDESAWYAQDEVSQEDSEQNEVDGKKKGTDSTGKVMHMWKSGWWFVMRKIRMVELGWQETRSEFYLKTEQR